MWTKTISWCLLVSQVWAAIVFAEEPLLRQNSRTDSPFTLSDPNARPSEYWAFLNLFVPGFGQWKDGQYTWGGIYTGVALGGATYAALNLDGGGERFAGMDRDVALGLKVFTTAAGLSAYHTYRTAVLAKQKDGDYSFLKHHETPGEIATAPFRFDYLARPTTLIPLAAVGALFFAILPPSENKTVRFSRVSSGDAAFSGSISYLAGLEEESVFRGMFMPMVMHETKNELLSNGVTASVFALAHVSFEPGEFFIPWPQFLFGLYAGWLTQHNEWTISEAIFLHAWYDVLAFTAHYATTGNIAFRLPGIRIGF